MAPGEAGKLGAQGPGRLFKQYAGEAGQLYDMSRAALSFDRYRRVASRVPPYLPANIPKPRFSNFHYESGCLDPRLSAPKPESPHNIGGSSKSQTQNPAALPRCDSEEWLER